MPEPDAKEPELGTRARARARAVDISYFDEKIQNPKHPSTDPDLLGQEA